MDKAVISKLERVLASGEYVVVKKSEAEALTACVGSSDLGAAFSEKDIEVLADIISVYRGLTAIGSVYRLAKSLAYGAAALAAIWLFLRHKLPFNEMIKAVFG